jgi:hypothetical protein
MQLWVSPTTILLTRDRRQWLLGGSHPDGAVQLAAPGGTIPLAVAEAYGLTKRFPDAEVIVSPAEVALRRQEAQEIAAYLPPEGAEGLGAHPDVRHPDVTKAAGRRR